MPVPERGGTAILEFDRPALERQATRLTADLVHFDTSNPPGNELACARFLQGVFRSEGIESEIIESAPDRANLVARIPGASGHPQLLLTSHLDVAPAPLPHEWTHHPFEGLLLNGEVWGRGSVDCKSLVAMQAVAILAIKHAGVRFTHDLLFAAVADEKVQGPHGMGYLLERRPETVLATYALNEIGAIPMQFGSNQGYAIDVAERGIAWLRLNFRGRAGHSSMPVRGNNALVRAAEAATRLAGHRPRLGEAPWYVREFFEAFDIPNSSALNGNERPGETEFSGSLPSGGRGGGLDALVTMTFSPNQISSSGDTNITPAQASLLCDCRLQPGQTLDDVLAEIERAGIRTSDLDIDVLHYHPASESDTRDPCYEALRSTLTEMVPGTQVVPWMLPTGSDSYRLRKHGVRVYGFQPMPPDEPPATLARVHGLDERISARSLGFGAEAIARAALSITGVDN